MRSLIVLLGVLVMLGFGAGCKSTPGEASGRTFTVEAMGNNAVSVNGKVVPADMLPTILRNEGAETGDKVIVTGTSRASSDDYRQISRILRQANFRNTAINMR